MIKVSVITYQLLQESEVAFEAMKAGVLNYRAFARQILPIVEERSLKPVKIGTIVVALSRISKALNGTNPLHPQVRLKEIGIKSPLVDITYEKNTANTVLVGSLVEQMSSSNGSFFTVTQGIDEITIVASSDLKQKILDHFVSEPKSLFENLVGISTSFDERYFHEPKLIYTILSRLAVKRIDILEIVSTYTELTVIVKREDMETTLSQLNTMFER